MTTPRRIGLLGGTFDPIHLGHVGVAEAAERALQLTRVIVIPSRVPPHRAQPTASSHHRFAMVALTVNGRPRWQVSDLELRGEPPSYTSTTLRHFRDRGCSASDLFFLIGADAFADIGSWKDYPEVLDHAHFAVVSRPGWPVRELPEQLPSLRTRMLVHGEAPVPSQPAIILIDAVTADVSSSAIRQRRSSGQPVGGLVAPGVQQHIEQHGLYTAALGGRRDTDRKPSAAAGRLHGKD
jgi:nicotinate-nucleotide adenylyltransferase